MMNLLRDEISGIYLFLKRNRSEVVLLSFTVLFVILKAYHPVWNQWFSYLLYYAFLPILVIIIILRKNPLDFGLKFGNPRIWGLYVAITCLVGLPILYFASWSAPLREYYRIEQFNPLIYFLETAVLLFAWEFYFRSFLLFGLKEKLAEKSIIVQMIPFVLLHIGKPEIEVLSTIVTGIYFGYIAYRGNSLWPAFIIHLFINISMVFFINLL